MEFNQSAAGTPEGSHQVDSLENQLRGMILTHNPHLSTPVQPFTQLSGVPRTHETPVHQQRQSVPLFGMPPGNLAGRLPYSDQLPYPNSLPTIYPMVPSAVPTFHGLPYGFFTPGDFSSAPVSAPTTAFAPPPSTAFSHHPGQYPGSLQQQQPPSGLHTTNLGSPIALDFSPGVYTVSQPQSLNMNMQSNTPAGSGNVQPQVGQQYKQQAQQPQQNTPPRNRGQSNQINMGLNMRGSPHGQRGHGSNKPQNTPRALPLNTLDHFPPLGTQPTKAKTPPPIQYQQQQQQQQQSGTTKPQQRTQYQPLPIDTRPNNPHFNRGAAYGRNRYNTLRHPQQNFAPEVSQYLNELSKKVIAVAAPPQSEVDMKHALLDRLEAISKSITPTAKLIPFGSLVTGFATANSDLDVIFTGGDDVEIFVENPDDPSSNFRIPILLEERLKEQGFVTTLLTRTRVPILKLVQKATEECPYELQCDIGFSNHLAIYNTQMLLTYSKCDPRVKDMMIFIKWWAKRRHINSPYRGTLSSYGYALMVLHYLINVVKPAVLQNLQIIPVPDDTATTDVVFESDSDETFDIWFYKDTEKLPRTINTMEIGELLKGFFEYYAHTFQWGREVVSIRTKGGIMSKQEKGWVAAVIKPGRSGDSEVKNRYLFAVEDPFETEHNVSRTCNGPGVNRIKEEFRRAVWLMKMRDGGKSLFETLCMEAPPERVWVRREDRDRQGTEEAVGDQVEGHQGIGDEIAAIEKHEPMVPKDGQNAPGIPV